MRLATHTVVFDRDPDFARYAKDPSGSVVRIVHLWLAEAGQGLPTIRHYLGSVRRCDCGGWVSRCELARLFRRATVAARLAGETGPGLRHSLSRYLREYFAAKQGPGAALAVRGGSRN
jgi:hypothetical protein